MADFRMRTSAAGLRRSTSNWEIMEAETVDKHTGNYSLTKHTSHHQPKPLQVKIYPHLLPTSFAISHNQLLVSHPPGLLIGLILLIELHLRNMWESGRGSSPRLRKASHFALPYYHNKHLQ